MKGLGPAKQESLKAAGIKTVEDLAKVDLRKEIEVEGVSQDALKTYKQRAKQLLGSSSTTKPAKKGPAKGGAKTTAKPAAKAPTKKSAKPAAKAPAKPAAKPAPTNGAVTPAAKPAAKPAAVPSSPSPTAQKKGWLQRLLRR